MAKLLLFRHGEPDHNDSLTAYGKETVIQNALLIPPVYHEVPVVYSSPRVRCIETAHLVSEIVLGQDSVVVVPAIHDVVLEEDFLPGDYGNAPYLRKFQNAVKELLNNSSSGYIILVAHCEQADASTGNCRALGTLKKGEFLQIDTDHLLSLGK